MVEIKAADLEVRCFFAWRMKGHNRFYGSGEMETGDWGLRVLKFDGAIAPRVLRFDAPPARGLWWRL